MVSRKQFQQQQQQQQIPSTNGGDTVIISEDSFVSIVFWIGLILCIIVCSLLNCYIEQRREKSRRRK